ncbi:hypothetical protein [Natronobeatus ordinarius]|uniref:DUF7847 domain-containing protein n=1 Tax=Natronobeatus ordinarius TaxID=2963433 RepID=UPI0020CD17E4|nr:hypothetical protein [Natronobeatus ordinarius]
MSILLDDLSMSVIGSLSTAVSVLRNNPVILLIGVFFILPGEISVLLDIYVSPLAQWLFILISLFVTPFLLGGLITMINEGLEGSTRLGSFVRGGKENYVSLLGATFLFVVLLMGVSFIGSLLMVFVGVIAAVAGAGLAGIVVGAVLLLAVLALLFLFIQFYDAAIVVSDARAIESFSHSIGLVRDNFLSVVGFSIAFLVITLLGQGPGMALYLSAVEFTDTGETVLASESTLYLSVAVTLVIGTIAMAYAYTYFITYYRSLVDDPAAATIQ